MPFHDPSLVMLGKTLIARAAAIEADIERLGQFLDPARVAALSEVASQFRQLARELGA